MQHLQHTTTSGNSKEQFLVTSHLTPDLKRRSVRGGLITLIVQSAKFTLQLGATAILARLLLPGDFGLVAMVAVFSGLAQLFTHAGLSIAVVQRKEVTHEQLTAIFWLNIVLSLLIALVLALAAPLIAQLYGEPRLVAICLLSAVGLALTGTAVQHHALLVRQMEYGSLAAIEILSLGTGLATSVALALAGASYWSLVYGPLTATVLNSVLLWRASGWRPGSPRRTTGTSSMIKFGGGVTAYNVLDHVIRQSDNLIVGALLGSGQLGLYTKAYGLLMLPVNQLSRPLGSVLVPALSRLQNDPARYRRAFSRAASALALLAVPLMTCLALASDLLVRLLLGPGWERAAKVFLFLAPAAIVGAVQAVPIWICLSLGRSRPQVLWAFISTPVLAAAFLLGSRWEIEGVALALSIAWVPLFALLCGLAVRGSPITSGLLFRDLGTPFGFAALATLCSLGIGTWIPWSPHSLWVSSAFRCTIFSILYGVLCMLSSHTRATLRYLLTDGVRAMLPTDPVLPIKRAAF